MDRGHQVQDQAGRVARDSRPVRVVNAAWEHAENVARERCIRLVTAGFKLSRNDRLVVRGAHFLVALGPVQAAPAPGWGAAFSQLDSSPPKAEAAEPEIGIQPERTQPEPQQAELFA